ncbi:hypothetical protein CDEF62S_02504 [Castellaniella defragrans]
MAVTAGQSVDVAYLNAGKLVFTPAPDANGTNYAGFTFQVQDNGGTANGGQDTDQSPNTITFNVTPVNDAPVNVGTIAAHASQDADTGISLDVSGRFTDVDDATLTYSATGLPTGLSIDATTGIISGTVDHSASQGATDGKYTVTVTATDPSGATSSQHFTWTVTNPAPIADDDAVTGNEDTVIAGSVIEGSIAGGAPGASVTPDSDPDGDALSVLRYTVEGHTYTAGSSAAVTGGLLTINADGSYTFTPEADWNGTVPSVTYTLTDGQGGLATAQLNITVNPVNDAPVPVSDAAVVKESGVAEGGNSPLAGTSTATGNVLTNDTDIDGDALHVSAVSFGATAGTVDGLTALQGTYGSLVIAADGSYTYTLDNSLAATQALASGQKVTEVFTYTAFDGTAGVDQTLTVTVTGTNDAPVIDVAGSAVSGSVVEAGVDGAGSPVGLATVAGTVVATDVDAGDTQHWAVTGSPDATYGTFAIDAATGQWTYALDDTKAATQALTAGQTVNLTYTVQVTDAHGATATQDVAITITGSNDIPTLSGTATGAVVEAGGLNNAVLNHPDAQGTVHIEDPDAGQSSFQIPASLNGIYGTFTFNEATGGWSYQLDNSRAATQLLAQGEKATDTLTVASADGTVTQDIVVTITGSNDTPVVTNGAGAVTEDIDVAAGMLVVQGTVANHQALTIVDADHDQSTFNTSTVAFASNSLGASSALGTLTVNTDGTWEYQVDNSLSQVQSLAAGQTITETFTVKSADGTAASTVTVTINGANDAPVNTVPDTSTTPFTTAEDTPLAVHGVSVADVDGDLLTTTLTVTGGTVSVATGTGATVNDDGTGTVTITGSAAQVNAALAGLTFTNAPDYHGNAQITVSTGDGSLTDTDTIAITVTPVQDVADDTFTTNEDTSMVLDVLANDSFEGAHKTVTAINGTAIAVHGTVAVDHGTVTLGADGKLTFTPEADYHGAASFQYTANTDTGVAETATATVTVNPVNDAPQGTDNSFTIDEDTSHTFTTADFGFSDPADGDAFKAVAITTLPTAGALTLNGVAVTAGQSVSVADLDAGKLVFTPAPDANGNAYANFTFQVQDDGGTAFGGHDTDPTPNTITFNVTAVNDAPVPVADVAAVKESGVADGGNSPVAGTPIATGNVLTNDTDVDGDTLQVSAVSFGGTAGTVDGVTALQGVYGSLVIAADGSYTYTLDNSLAATQGLASGQKVTEAFTYTAFDGTIGVDQTLTVTVTGTNDAPVIDGAHSTVSGGVTEAGVDGAGDPVGLATVSGVVNATDVDAGDTQHWSVSTGGQSAAGAYGSLTIDAATGEWVYALDDTKPATQALKAGDTPTETFTAVVTDSHGATATQVITVTVNGSNDAASISGTATGATTEDGGILNAAKGQATAGGQLQVADVDAGENHFQTPASLAGAYGSFTFDPLTGVWSYQLDNSSAATQALAQGEKATDTLTVTSADGTAHQDIVVTITGSNDVPVVTNGTGAVTEDVDVGAEAAGMLTAHGTTANGRALTITDADHDQSTFDTGTVAFASNSLGSGSALGTLTVNADGTWEYQVDNSLSQVQSLAAGQTITETFTVKSADGTAASTVTVTITGANDAPYITSTAAAAAGSVVEAGVDGTGHAIGMATATGILTGDDVDSDDDPASLRWSLQSGGQSATGAYGSLTLDAATGKWTYTLDDTKPATQTLRAGDTAGHPR